MPICVEESEQLPEVLAVKFASHFVFGERLFEKKSIALVDVGRQTSRREQGVSAQTGLLQTSLQVLAVWWLNEHVVEQPLHLAVVHADDWTLLGHQLLVSVFELLQENLLIEHFFECRVLLLDQGHQVREAIQWGSYG